MSAWTAEVGVAGCGVSAAWAARLLDSRGHVVWRGGERLPAGRSVDDALRAGAAAVRGAAIRHRRKALVRTNLRRPGVVGVEVADLPEAAAAARALLPARAGFSTPQVELVGEYRAVAHGTKDYTLDLLARTCSCPDYRYRSRLCKHLKTALGVGGLAT